MSNKQNSEEQTQGYICPVTKVQCDDECCVSAEDCHIKSGYGILSSNDKQSNSIEWLYFAMEGFIDKSARVHFVEYFEKAKAMHREEHGKTWDESMDNFIARGENYVRAYVDFEDYYAETFGGKNEN